MANISTSKPILELLGCDPHGLLTSLNNFSKLFIYSDGIRVEGRIPQIEVFNFVNARDVVLETEEIGEKKAFFCVFFITAKI